MKKIETPLTWILAIIILVYLTISNIQKNNEPKCENTSKELKETHISTYNKNLDVDSIIDAVIEETDSIIETAIETTDNIITEEN